MNPDPMPLSSLTVSIAAKDPQSHNIPKNIEIINDSLEVVKSEWLQSDHYKAGKLSPGFYVVRLNLTSGNRQEKVVELTAGEDTSVRIDLESISPRESQEWAYFSKSMLSSRPSAEGNQTAVQGIQGRLWTYYKDIEEYPLWRHKPVMPSLIIDQIGETYNLTTASRMHVLQVTGPGIPPRCVCLPPNHKLNCLIKRAQGPSEVVHPLDITVSTRNWKSEALLALLTSGDILRAKTLTNIEESERLLYEKMVDPAAAAVGAYFLLKVGALERLHNWAENLANRFPWLPDGAVIHAWQMLQEGKKSGKIEVDRVRERLLEAVARGIPVYTEGLRLLHEGLCLLAMNSAPAGGGKDPAGDGEDAAVQNALTRTKAYVQAADMTQETTTFTGIRPDEPGAQSAP